MENPLEPEEWTGPAWLWVDRNGDGDFQAEEYTAIAEKQLNIFRAQFVDDEGTFWFGTQNGKLRRFPLNSISEHGVPLYSAETMSIVDVKTIDPEIKKLRDVKYMPATDTMFFCTTSEANSMGSEWFPMGTEVRRYDNWSKTPERRFAITLPYDFSGRNGGGIIPMSMAAADGYVFVAFAGGANPKKRRACEVIVYRAADGKVVGVLSPDRKLGRVMMDFQIGALNARKRPDGTYVVFVEEDACGRVVYYQWKPADTGTVQ